LLAKIAIAQRDLPTAITALQKAIAAQPDSPTAYIILAQLYAGARRSDQALATLHQLLGKHPDSVPALALTGMIEEQQKDYVAARDDYEKLLTFNPKVGVALNNLACLYSEHFGQLDKARTLAQQAHDLMPRDAGTADILGWILSRQHQYPQALALLRGNEENLPKDAAAQAHLGITLYLMGEEGPARLELQRALKISTDFSGSDEVRRCLAILDTNVESAGPEARARLEEAVAQRPDDPIAR